MTRIGIDIGSTTIKIAAINAENHLVFSTYKRHHAKTRETLLECLHELLAILGDGKASVGITGSVGMGVSEQCGLPFVQEVVAAANAIRKNDPPAASLIDIGGEDAKVVFFKDGEPTDLRMNGNCAGGTGAFIDQMAIILGVSLEELNRLALAATRIYPIASRCGVFCKTDIQNLIAKNASREDIAASIFHAVAVQTVTTLAHGYDITPPVVFCGGPLTFIPALRKAFTDYLSLEEKDMILPEYGTLLPAIGTALALQEEAAGATISGYITKIEQLDSNGKRFSGLAPIFRNEEDYREWHKRISQNHITTAHLQAGIQEAYLGIDSGSTTTKITVIDDNARLLYTYYSNNNGNPIRAVEAGLLQLQEECKHHGTTLRIKGSCSTGYGEDLIKAAFQLQGGIIETIAHYLAACQLDKDVSFILDIGGQDMKAIFINRQVIDRIEINEACSSGCGSFMETFAKSLGYGVHEFAEAACHAETPCDLGTRCTVFMNSKVKQVLREGATVNDIAAGLAYSVVKNCLYKVLKLKDTSALGKHIVVQGGTMRNDAVVRAIELLTGCEVSRCDSPELMGAFGCSLYALRHAGSDLLLDDMLRQAQYTTANLTCQGCENHCNITRYRFGNGKNYYSGNRCEKIFTNGDKDKQKGENIYTVKNELLFQRHADLPMPRLTIGIPRALNMYEEYPFWHTLFTACNIQVELSAPSNFKDYEQTARMVMSDNICFPAKLVHSHIQDLLQKKVDRIFMPFVLFEKKGKEQNSYNCPIVSGYSEVVKSVQAEGIPLDSPAITFKDRSLLFKQCRQYLSSLSIDEATITEAFHLAEQEQEHYINRLVEANEAILRHARETGGLTILLAGRPYHTDKLIQHKVADMMADMGIHVLSDDIVRRKDIPLQEIHFVSQWAYPNRILKAAQWCATESSHIQMVEMTSFGCGPDAFLTDEVRDLLMRHNKALTLLKLDDINNIGSMKLRVRSMLESLRLALAGTPSQRPDKPFATVPIFDKPDRRRTILVPFFTPFLSPLIPAVMKVAGYRIENLPLSDEASCEWGLKYANNEVCYPATLIVGDIIKALKSGKYPLSDTAVAITQTGGQCRASNYISLIKKALVDAGFRDIPVISVTFGDTIKNLQPGFKINWLRLLPLALHAILFSDCIAKFYYASVIREKVPGIAAKVRDSYLELASEAICRNNIKKLEMLLKSAAEDFDAISTDRQAPKVGIVGEIFLKFNPFAQRHVIDWFIEQKIEVIPPIMTDFFMQNFVNRKVKTASFLQRKQLPNFVYDRIYGQFKKQIQKINAIASRFRYFIPFHDIFEEAGLAQEVISLNAQFGEGWLLPAEIVSYARQGVHNVVSLQPFGCIANHIVSKGIEKRIKNLYPDIRLLSLDFDSGVSQVNMVNRLLLFIDNLKK